MIIAFALLIKEEDTLIFKHVGLDYSINRESYAYFNLFFMAINFAIDNGYKSMLCGSTTYDVKLNLGCKLIDRKATIIFNGQQSDNSLDFFEYLNFGENDEK